MMNSSNIAFNTCFIRNIELVKFISIEYKSKCCCRIKVYCLFLQLYVKTVISYHNVTFYYCSILQTRNDKINFNIALKLGP